MALGGMDTGCLDFESNGLLGYCTMFNTHVPRHGHWVPETEEPFRDRNYFGF
jgi:hypothetical protein